MSDNFIVNMKQKGENAKSFKEIIKRIQQKSYPISISAGHSVFLDFILSLLAVQQTQATLILFKSEKDAGRAFDNLQSWGAKVFFLPSFSPLIYEGISTSEELLARRSFVLHAMARETPALYLASLESAIIPIPSRESLLSNVLNLYQGQEIDPSEVVRRLADLGYKQAPFLTSLGEFSLKGSVLDIFSYPESYRLHFDFDTLADIKLLNVLEHFSHTPQSSVTLLALQERLWDDRAQAKLEAKFPDLRESSPWFWENIANFGKSRGQELYFGTIEDNPVYLWDFFGFNTPVFCVDSDQYETTLPLSLQEKETLWSRHREQFPFLPEPSRVLLSTPLLSALSGRNLIHFPRFRTSRQENIAFDVDEEKNFAGNLILFKEQLATWQSEDYTIYLSTESDAQRDKLEYLFRDSHLKVVMGTFSHSFIWTEERIAFVTEKELFGRTGQATSTAWREKPTQIIDSFVDLKEGSYIVHVQYGIGIFLGIERKTFSGVERDYFALEYAGKEKILIPIEQTNLVQRYIHSDGHVNLDKIGSKSWEKRKTKARVRANDIADHLITLYSQRQRARGFAFRADDEWQMTFESTFPYNETPDQKQAITEIKADMESTRPMDRLLCGDVGFGKTEVAMRAAFKAVMSGKQVVIMAPTTILAEQHHENFKDRFSHFPVTIALLSRFTGARRQREVLEQLIKGEIDILIGTHRVLSVDVKFKNLGLLVIDEEQRFGVKAKEELKSLRINLDILTLSATPIPRTLHISLVKLRDISTLATPPVNRKPIETVVAPFTEDIVRHAIEAELERGGQIFFLHNRIETLDSVKTFLERVVPYALVEVAHGQMSGDDLESIMHRFTHNHFQILISTSIIENGIDIPNANTIIVDQAHLYGLAQLYQLRGRVGRRGEGAFAYLLYPADKSLNEVAIKRLEVLSENTALGSGFKIAMKDLEIRGMGNLLGSEQSGEIEAVGLDMYLQLLEEAMSSRLGQESELLETYLDLTYQGFIPTEYIPSSQEKMEIYKRLAGLRGEEELVALRESLWDRFGSLPEVMEPFLQVAELRILATKLKIANIVERQGRVKVTFRSEKDIPIDKFMHLFDRYRQRVDLIPQESNAFYIKVNEAVSQDKLNRLTETLSSLL